MKLLVVSHTPHFRRADGTLVGFGPTVRELNHLAGLFERVVHLAPLHEAEPAPPSSLPYAAPNLEYRPLRPSGGPRPVDKLGILGRWPGYLRAILAEARRADAVHVRAPANVSLLAILALTPGWRPWWVKYAGNWRPADDDREPPSYAFQRAWLSRSWRRLAVTVNGRWPELPRHVLEFHNPCLTAEQARIARQASAGKTLDTPLRLLFVGNLDANKGPDRAVRILAAVRRSGIDARLDLAGDGPLRSASEALAREFDLEGSCRFHGALPRPELDQLYRRAHLLLLPSRTEGWPKVVSEAMAWGVVPIASAISGLPHAFESWGVGRTVPTDGTEDGSEHGPTAFADAVVDYASRPESWLEESGRAREAIDPFTYDHYLDSVRRLFLEQWKIDSLQRAPTSQPTAEG